MKDSLIIEHDGEYAKAARWAEGAAAAAGWPPRDAADIGLCVADAAREAREGAYRGAVASAVLLSLDVDEQEVALELMHEGAPVRIGRSAAAERPMNPEPCRVMRGCEARIVRLSRRR